MGTFDFLPNKPITDPRMLVGFTRGIVALRPEHHDQETWIGGTGEDGYALDFDGLELGERQIDLNDFKSGQVDCGTTCCVAGWLVTLAGGVWTDTNTVRLPGRDDALVPFAAADLIEPLLDGRDDLDSCFADDLFAPGQSQQDVLDLLDELLS